MTSLTVGGLAFGRSGSRRLLGWPDMVRSGAARGTDLTVPFAEGGLYRRRWRDVAVFEFPVRLLAESHALLTSEIRSVRSALAPDHSGVTAATWEYDGTSWGADVHASLDGSEVSPFAYHGWLQLTVPGSVWRRSTATSASSALGSSTRDVTVPNGGPMQFGLRVSLTGSATSVTLSNESWDGVWLTFGGNLTGGVEIDCLTWSATRGGSPVPGLVTYSGHERWLPLRPGDNTIEIAPAGGNVAVTFEHNEVW